jgi:nicotinate-nucleotide pyrophosphorylase (carboxylating)
VQAGAGANHRFGLDDAMLIKDDHIAIAGSIGAAVERARLGVDPVSLDNMTLEKLRQVVTTTVAARFAGHQSSRRRARSVTFLVGLKDRTSARPIFA